MKIRTLVREWGSSLGVILPREIVREENLRVGDEVVVEVLKRPSIEILFGLVKSKESAQEIKEELRKGW